jgi:polar amino acid transport system substrate-binding protein
MFARQDRPTAGPQGWRARRPWAIGIGLTALMAMVLSACGGGGTTTAQGTPISGAAPTSTVNCSSGPLANLHLVTPNELTIGSDTTYAPAEYVDPSNPTNYIGYDMDLARELARRLCLGPHIVTATFSTIITDLSGPTLGQQPWDMSISSFTINSSREQKVDMIPYFIAGESMLVQTGNPKNIKSVTDLCGQFVSVQNGTIEQFELQDANGTGTGENDGGVTQPPVCKSNPIKLLGYDSQEDVVNQVVNGRAVGAYQDEPVTAYYAGLPQNAGKVAVGYVTQGSRGTEGIVMRKDNPDLENAIKTALNNMVHDGTYLRIMKAWGQESLACLVAAGGCPPPTS